MTEARVLGLEHVTVTTPEELEQEVVEWYERCIGLERIEKPEGTNPSGAWFRVGDQQLHVLVDPHNPPKDAHYCLRVDDFDAFVGKLRDARVHIEQAAARPGRQRCFTRDPAGNSIEIVALEGEA
ncbi:MAG: VOC family protein [Actinomycetota bacterium]|nr:VOC family protein [Actinomycetota bacterium]